MEDKKYLISEEELNNLITKSYSVEEFEEKKLVKKFLKSKQSVEEIAGGKVDYNWYGDEESILIGGEYLSKHFKEIAEKNYHKDIKIYIEVSK